MSLGAAPGGQQEMPKSTQEEMPNQNILGVLSAKMKSAQERHLPLLFLELLSQNCLHGSSRSEPKPKYLRLPVLHSPRILNKLPSLKCVHHLAALRSANRFDLTQPWRGHRHTRWGDAALSRAESRVIASLLPTDIYH